MAAKKPAKKVAAKPAAKKATKAAAKKITRTQTPDDIEAARRARVVALEADAARSVESISVEVPEPVLRPWKGRKRRVKEELTLNKTSTRFVYRDVKLTTLASGRGRVTGTAIDDHVGPRTFSVALTKKQVDAGGHVLTQAIEDSLVGPDQGFSPVVPLE